MIEKSYGSLLVAFYDTQGIRWVYSSPAPTGRSFNSTDYRFLRRKIEGEAKSKVKQTRSVGNPWSRV
ncbi:hypothetical protein K0M31_001630 [Melipona bicolor]|uniref:Uncharacterized protein n=1 Tax=Melipona bicolor TaxID=60889 RepID=A0AA40KY05_9HYME|nr:hypothetical protein K0M31_001630 [Melipona bicolor]